MDDPVLLHLALAKFGKHFSARLLNAFFNVKHLQVSSISSKAFENDHCYDRATPSE